LYASDPEGAPLLYRQVSYDHEPIFRGAMLSVENCFAVLAIIDVCEKVGSM